jgi:hypothetical protein
MNFMTSTFKQAALTDLIALMTKSELCMADSIILQMPSKEVVF